MRWLRLGLYLLFGFAVVAFGAVDVWAMSALEIGAAALFLVWALVVCRDAGANIYWSPLNWPLLGLLGVGVLQLVVHRTAYPFATRTEILRLAAYFLIFFLSAQAFRGREEMSQLAWLLTVFCFVVSLLAIAQHFTSNEEIYWMSEFQSGGSPFGPYVNRNHFAGFVELTFPMGLALMAFRAVRREARFLVGLLAIVPASAVVLSGSRGGIIAVVFEMAILVLLVRSRRRLHGRRVAAGAVIVVAALAMIAWVGAEQAVAKFSALKFGDVSLERRVSMFIGAARIFHNHPIQGAGLGTLVDVYPRYERNYDGYVVDHVHNDYLEVLAEAGLLGGVCGLVFLWRLYRQAAENFQAEQGHFSRGLHAGAITAVSGLLLHSFVDFNLHIPANALLFLLMSYLAISPPLPSSAARTPHSAKAAGEDASAE